MSRADDTDQPKAVVLKAGRTIFEAVLGHGLGRLLDRAGLRLRIENAVPKPEETGAPPASVPSRPADSMTPYAPSSVPPVETEAHAAPTPPAAPSFADADSAPPHLFALNLQHADLLVALSTLALGAALFDQAPPSAGLCRGDDAEDDEKGLPPAGLPSRFSGIPWRAGLGRAAASAEPPSQPGKPPSAASRPEPLPIPPLGERKRRRFTFRY